MRLAFNGDRVSVGEGEKSSGGAEGGGGYTTTWTDVSPLNQTLEKWLRWTSW